MPIVVTTPTGQIGSRLVEQLLKRGADVAVLVRDPNKLPESVRDRVRVHQGSQDDPSAVRAATQGAESLFWLTPPDPAAPDPAARSAQFQAAAVSAIETNAIPRVVHLSSVRADHATGMGLISITHRDELSLDGTPASVLHLRPGFFFENFLQYLDPIRQNGIVPVPSPGTTPVPMIATADIADAAAEALLNPTWSGRTIRALHGPTDLTWRHAVEILGQALNKPLQYVELTSDQFRQAASAFASPNWIDLYLEMVQGFSTPGALAEPRTSEATTPTTLETWARNVLAPKLAS